MSRYGVKSVFVTLQGEGARAGTKAVFIRFSGCNLWDGHPLHRDRGEGSCARWCDTDFFKGRAMGHEDIIELANSAWGQNWGEKWVVLTGGEPCLQIDQELMTALHDDGWKIAIETNGTEPNDAAMQADYICVAPKLNKIGERTMLVIGRADEVKVVLPGALPNEPGWTPDMLSQLEIFVQHMWKGARLYVQPQDPLVDQSLVSETALVRNTSTPGVDAMTALHAQLDRNTKRCIDHVMANPHWALSIQQHKMIGLE